MADTLFQTLGSVLCKLFLSEEGPTLKTFCFRTILLLSCPLVKNDLFLEYDVAVAAVHYLG